MTERNWPIPVIGPPLTLICQCITQPYLEEVHCKTSSQKADKLQLGKAKQGSWSLSSSSAPGSRARTSRWSARPSRCWSPRWQFNSIYKGPGKRPEIGLKVNLLQTCVWTPTKGLASRQGTECVRLPYDSKTLLNTKYLLRWRSISTKIAVTKVYSMPLCYGYMEVKSLLNHKFYQ